MITSQNKPLTSDRDPRIALWRDNCLAYKLRPNGQRKAYDFIHGWKASHPNSGGPVILNCHRRFGKSFLSILLGVERAISRPRQRVRIVAPTKVQGTGIFAEQWTEIMRDCPSFIEVKERGDEIQIFNHDGPHWKKASPAHDYSSIFLHGSEAGGGERLRGQGADMIILDEPRDMSDLEYLLKNVLGWHLVKRKRPLMVIISTPPRTTDHYLTAKLIPEANEAHRYFIMPISSDADMSPEDVQFILELCGTKESIAWQREGECALLADPGHLVLYEWSRYENACRIRGQPNDLIFSEYKRPEFYYPRTTIDAGFGDANGIIFWFWNYKAQKFIVLDEIFARGLNSSEIANLVREKEREVFQEAALFDELRRDGDLTPQQQEDLRVFFKFDVRIIDRHDKMAAIDVCNASIAHGNVMVHEKCENLLFQLRNASFKKDSQLFMRTERMGHCDMVASLISAHRDLPRAMRSDPFPVNGKWIGHQFVPDEEEEERVGDARVLSEKTYQL